MSARRGKKSKNFKNNPSQPPALSLCMIVRNEETYLKACLESVATIVDEIIIVDTGSTDESIEIAKNFAARIVVYPWDNNFAAARNEGLRHAHGRWVLYLDADERLLPGSVPELQRIIRRKDCLYVNLLIENVQPDGKTVQITRGHRLFRNVPGVCFSGRIHEQVSPFFAQVDGKELFSSIKIKHLGYAKSTLEMQKKYARNAALLKLQLAEDPENAYCHYTYAQNLILTGWYEESLPHLQRALIKSDLPDDLRCSVYNNYADVYFHLQDYSKAIDYAYQSIEQNPHQNLAYLLLYKLYGELGDRRQQIACLEQVRQLMEMKKTCYNDISAETSVHPFFLYLNLGKLYFADSDFESAKICLNRASQQQPENKEVLTYLADCFIALREFKAGLVCLKKMCQLYPDDLIMRDKLGWLFIKTGDLTGAVQVYTDLEKMLPGNEKLRKRLAGLYYKLGDMEKSHQFLAMPR